MPLRQRPHDRPEKDPMTRQHAPTCEDCYFRRNGLCAMAPERPCPTFRAAARTLQPPRQPRLVPLASAAAAAVAVA
jgi:hypothetical protein